MHDVYLVQRSDLTYSDLAGLLDAARIDTLVDVRPSDEPGDFSFSVLGALCSAFGFGYLRRSYLLGQSAAGPGKDEALAAAVGGVRELARHGRVALLCNGDMDHLATPAQAHGLSLAHLQAPGTIRPFEDHLPVD